MSYKTKSRNVKLTVGVTGQEADYICDGTNDDVEINAAVTAVNAGGGGIVQFREGTYILNNTITPKSYVSLVGAGKQKTLFNFTTTPAASNMITSGSGTLLNFEVCHVTLDAQSAMKGLINCATTVQEIEIHDCEFLNMGCDNSHSHWALRFGNVVDADLPGSASYNCHVYNNLFYNLSCGTFEVILLPNVRDSFFHHNKFENNATSSTREVSFYSFNVNCRYSENIHLNWSQGAVHTANCDQIDIMNNTFTSTTIPNATALDIRNTINSKVCNNNITLYDTGQGDGIDFQDDNVGRDGHTLLHPNSYNLDFSGNTFTNVFYGIKSITSTSVNMNFKYITISNNKFYNCLKAPIRIGPNTSSGVTLDIQYIFVRDNAIYSWIGSIEGAIGFFGDTTEPTAIKNIYIENNYVGDNTTAGTSGAVRISAAQVQSLKDNYIVVSTGSYGSVSLPNSGTIQNSNGNIGYDSPTSTYVGINDTQKLTNKRVTKRTGTTTSSATPTINTDNVDFYSLTAQAVDVTSFTTNLTGTPTENQPLWIAITGTASRAITWGASFESSTATLPTTTSGTSRLDVGFAWNTVSNAWRCVAVI
jgi:hypothetical protein